MASGCAIWMAFHAFEGSPLYFLLSFQAEGHLCYVISCEFFIICLVFHCVCILGFRVLLYYGNVRALRVLVRLYQGMNLLIFDFFLFQQLCRS